MVRTRMGILKQEEQKVYLQTFLDTNWNQNGIKISSCIITDQSRGFKNFKVELHTSSYLQKYWIKIRQLKIYIWNDAYKQPKVRSRRYTPESLPLKYQYILAYLQTRQSSFIGTPPSFIKIK